jgi:hypothetical protein
MGGSVNVLVRFSDNDKKAFRVHTSNLKDFENPLFLDEKAFKTFIMDTYYKGEPLNKDEHDDYYSQKTYFCPYAYGLLFFDLKERKIFSNNGYDGFLSFNCMGLFSKLSKIIFSAKKLNISLYEQEEIINGFNEDHSQLIPLEKYKIFNEPSISYSNFYMINHALKNDWVVKANQHVINHDGDFINFMNHILNKNIINETENIMDGYEWKIRTEFESSFQDYIDIFPKGWTIIQGDNSLEDIKSLLEYMTIQNIINEEEIIYWHEYLKERD